MSAVDDLPRTFHPGDVISGFRLLEIIGQGSSGIVWKAQSNNQTVAIKVMHSHLLEAKRSDIHLRQFHQEVKILAALIRHPHIPRLLLVEMKALPPYFVMSLAPGQSFEEELASGVMMMRPIKARLQVLALVAGTIDFIHQNSILHRDIKPGNIRGWHKPYLVDFSISSPLDQLHQQDPHHGTNLYKPPYPDYHPGIFDDIFAFAVVCYQLIFNRHPILSSFELSDNLVQLMYDKLSSKTWYKPTKLPSAQLPLFLQGANLDALDKIFERAFHPETGYANAQQIVDALADVIMDINNVDYVDLVPDDENLSEAVALLSRNFTDNEIRVNSLDTDIRTEPSRGQSVATLVKSLLSLLRKG